MALGKIVLKIQFTVCFIPKDFCNINEDAIVAGIWATEIIRKFYTCCKNSNCNNLLKCAKKIKCVTLAIMLIKCYELQVINHLFKLHTTIIIAYIAYLSLLIMY